NICVSLLKCVKCRLLHSTVLSLQPEAYSFHVWREKAFIFAKNITFFILKTNKRLVFLSAPGGSGVGVVRATGDSYFLSADVSGFEPHEVVLLVYNQCVAIHAEKMAADGSVAGRFTHKSVLPADMDPLSVSSSLTAERRLIISVGRRKSPVTSDL
uniref:SHSP domain-containing protein n=1 Tax=Sinocyclocheilus grahami TaxID=75366 RepID=A0A672MVE8_SINGR